MSAVAKPSRRACLFGATAAAGLIAGDAAASGLPAVASPEITAAIAAYWARVAEANARGASDELIDLKCEEMEDAAAELAAAPCRGLADLAAKIVFFVEVMNHENAWHSLTDAEGDVLVRRKPACWRCWGQRRERAGGHEPAKCPAAPRRSRPRARSAQRPPALPRPSAPPPRRGAPAPAWPARRGRVRR